jgi:hypothetical protein
LSLSKDFSLPLLKVYFLCFLVYLFHINLFGLIQKMLSMTTHHCCYIFFFVMVFLMVSVVWKAVLIYWLELIRRGYERDQHQDNKANKTIKCLTHSLSTMFFEWFPWWFSATWFNMKFFSIKHCFFIIIKIFVVLILFILRI